MRQGVPPPRSQPPLLTNSAEVDRAMGVKCNGGHRHVHLMAGRARAAAHDPAKFCRALCKGMRRQARVDASGMMSAVVLNAVSDEVGEISHIEEPWKKYWDDISGK